MAASELGRNRGKWVERGFDRPFMVARELFVFRSQARYKMAVGRTVFTLPTTSFTLVLLIEILKHTLRHVVHQFSNGQEVLGFGQLPRRPFVRLPAPSRIVQGLAPEGAYADHVAVGPQQRNQSQLPLAFRGHH